MLFFHVGFTRGSGTSWLPRDSGSKGETMMDKLRESMTDRWHMEGEHLSSQGDCQ